MASKQGKSLRKNSAHLKLSFAENAYSFLNQSLRHYRKTSRSVGEWPFALLHITQSIELLLKEVLRRIHPILIYEDIDKPKRTASLEQALLRLETVGVAIVEKERVNIRKASENRNRVVHSDIELNKFEWKNVYAQLFEFVHFFHHKHFAAELHLHVARENWAVEARLMRYFRENFVVYNGLEMHKRNPKYIIDAQRRVYVSSGRRRYRRIKYGDEPGWLKFNEKFADIPCHDCGVVKGQYHTDGCDVEECPKCHHQLLSCACSAQTGEWFLSA